MLPDKNSYSINEFLNIFDIDKKDFEPLTKMHKNVTAAQKAVDEFKMILKSKYRKAALKYHPDHGGSKEDFQVINKMYQSMMKSVKVIKQPPVQYMRMYYHYSGSATSSTTTQTWW